MCIRSKPGALPLTRPPAPARPSTSAATGVRWMETQMEEQNKFISPGDLDLVTVTEDVDEALHIILDYMRRVGPPEAVPKAFA